MSIYDDLLLSPTQLDQLKAAKEDYRIARKSGDQAAMKAAHNRAEKIRNAAGYSGGADGGTYQLLSNGQSPDGYSGYEKIVQNYATSGMQDIASGYQNTMKALAKEREAIEQEAEQNQAAARSAAWGVQRLAGDGMLTRGLENTGLADVITATALNQAAANAYQALLDRQENLRSADLAAIDAKAEALQEAKDLQEKAASMLSEGYSDFYEESADREQQLLMDRLNYEQEKELSKQEHQQALAQDQQKYQQDLALKKLAQQFDIDLSKLSASQKKQLAQQEYNYEVAIAKLKHQWEKEKR